MAPPSKQRSRSVTSTESERAARRKRSRERATNYNNPENDNKSKSSTAIKKEDTTKPPTTRRTRSRSRSASSGSSSRSGSSSSSSSSSSGSDDSGSDSSSSSSGSESGSEARRGSIKKEMKEEQRSVDKDRKETTRDIEIKKEPDAKPSPVSRLFIARLTANVTKDHVTEIFGKFGKVRDVLMPMNDEHPNINRSIAKVEFETPEDAAKAMRFMNGGQIDGQAIHVSMKEEDWENEATRKGGRFMSERGRGNGGSFGYAGGGGRRSSPVRRSRSRSPARYGRRSRSRSPHARR